MKEIALRGKYGIGKSVIVDDDVYEWASKWKLFVSGSKKQYNNKYVVRGHKRGVITYLHKEIVKAKKGERILFIDGNYLNCQRDNLDHKQSTPIEIDKETGAIKVKLYGKHGIGKVALVDPENFDKINQRRWQVDTDGYAILTVNKNGKTFALKMHRIIINAPKGMEVDHINGNRLDNRKCNLRLATGQQNRHNMRKVEANTSGYKGVVWDKRTGRWIVQIHLNNKKIYGKMQNNIIDAAKEYDRLARKYFGEFARTNF